MSSAGTKTPSDAYNDTPVADWHERSPLTLAYSKDEGKTWKNLIELAAAPGNKCQPPCAGTGTPSECGIYEPAYGH